MAVATDHTCARRPTARRLHLALLPLDALLANELQQAQAFDRCNGEHVSQRSRRWQCNKAKETLDFKEKTAPGLSHQALEAIKKEANSILDAALRRYAGLEGMLDEAHFRHRIGNGDDFLRTTAPRKTDMDIPGARCQGFQHIG